MMMEKRINSYLIRKENCYGCMACYNICPSGAIDIVEDEEGFIFPGIDRKKCTNCGMCYRICPSLNREDFDRSDRIEEQKGYIAQNTDTNIRIMSTSGGIFGALAMWCIWQGGVVFGALLDDKQSVVHSFAETVKDCEKFRGSKYVQSNVGKSYELVKNFLQQDRYVLFSGTPCQIAGLFSFLGREYDKLLTVDVVCRGILSPGVFRNYLEFQRQSLKKTITRVQFREKRWGYKYTAMTIYSDRKCIYARGPESDGLLRAFFENIYNRSTCYHCQYREQNRKSDLTLWDCFNVNLYNKKMDDDKGTNKVLAHSIKGKKVIEELAQKNIISLYEVPVTKLISENTESMYEDLPLTNTEKRIRFFYDYARKTPIDLWRKYYPDSLKVKMKRLTRKFLIMIGIYQIARRIKNGHAVVKGK